MDDLLAAEEQIERAWCDLDREWQRLLREAQEDATRIVLEAETEAAHILRDAHDDAAAVVEDAHGEAAALLLEAQERADRIVAEARRAVVPAPRPTPVDDPTGIRDALQRLRSELSNVVDAALDAFPAIEATAELFAEAAPAPVPAASPAAAGEADLRVPEGGVGVLVRRPGRLRRLLRLA